MDDFGTTDTTAIAPVAMSPKTKAQAIIAIASRIDRRKYLFIGLCLLGVVFTASSFRSPNPEPIEVSSPIEEALPATPPSFDRGLLAEGKLQQIQETERQYSAFLDEQSQRFAIAYAYDFKAKAAQFSQIPGHVCAGLSQLGCLNTFWDNREKTLGSLSNKLHAQRAEVGNGQDRLTTLAQMLEEHYKILGLRLAIAIETPAQSRTTEQQTWIDINFRILNSSVPPSELYPEPTAHQEILGIVANSYRQIGIDSDENRAFIGKIEACLQLPLDEQPENGCYGGLE